MNVYGFPDRVLETTSRRIPDKNDDLGEFHCDLPNQRLGG